MIMKSSRNDSVLREIRVSRYTLEKHDFVWNKQGINLVATMLL